MVCRKKKAFSGPFRSSNYQLVVWRSQELRIRGKRIVLFVCFLRQVLLCSPGWLDLVACSLSAGIIGV
jgi:hypothetical protein